MEKVTENKKEELNEITKETDKEIEKELVNAKLLEAQKTIVQLIDEVKEGKVPIGALWTRPRKHYKKAFHYERMIERYPAFINCVLIRCRNITKCWDLKKMKFVKGISGCELPSRLWKLFLKKQPYFAKVEHRTFPFSRLELGLIHTALAYLKDDVKYLPFKVQRVMEKIASCQTMYGLKRINK